jgi:hypothetical protein
MQNIDMLPFILNVFWTSFIIFAFLKKDKNIYWRLNPVPYTY